METEKKRSNWTDWTEISDGIMYKTNFKKVRIKYPVEYVGCYVVAESCCCKDDVFNLDFGIGIALLRCLVKSYEKEKIYFTKKMDENIVKVENDIKEMIDSLED